MKKIFDKLVDPKKNMRLIFTVESNLNHVGELWPPEGYFKDKDVGENNSNIDKLYNEWLEKYEPAKPSMEINGQTHFIDTTNKVFQRIDYQKSTLEAYCFIKDNKFHLVETSINYGKRLNKDAYKVVISIEPEELKKIYEKLDLFLSHSDYYYDNLGQIKEDEVFFLTTDVLSKDYDVEILPYKLSEEEFFIGISVGNNQHTLLTKFRNYSFYFEEFLQRSHANINYEKKFFNHSDTMTDKEIEDEELKEWVIE